MKKAVRVLMLSAIATIAFEASLYAEVSLLGLDPTGVVEKLGSPARVYVARSEEVGLASVVFFYDDFRYLYFYDNRVWQVRYDERSEEHVLGLPPDSPRRDVLYELGPAVYEDVDSAVFELGDYGFPVRVRTFFENGRLVDTYIYRADY